VTLGSVVSRTKSGAEKETLIARVLCLSATGTRAILAQVFSDGPWSAAVGMAAAMSASFEEEFIEGTQHTDGVKRHPG
jgi:hypothetical protein